MRLVSERLPLAGRASSATGVLVWDEKYQKRTYWAAFRLPRSELDSHLAPFVVWLQIYQMSSDARRILVLGSEPHALALAACAARAGGAVTLAALEAAPHLERIIAQAGLQVSGLIEAGFAPLQIATPAHLPQAV